MEARVADESVVDDSGADDVADARVAGVGVVDESAEAARRRCTASSSVAGASGPIT